MINFGEIITQIMEPLSRKDFNRALPYLLLTSKSESIVRDRLAFRLRKQFQGRNYAIAREWRRTDSAVLAPILRRKTKQFEGPKAIIEGKMVIAPGKDGKNIHKYLEILERQLRQNAWFAGSEDFQGNLFEQPFSF